MGYLLSIIIFQTLFTLMLILVTKDKHNEVFEKLLTMLLVLMSVHFSIKLIFLFTKPSYFSLPSSFSLVYGPVVYLLIMTLIKKPKKITIILHFLPFICMSIAYVFVLLQLHSFPLKNSLLLPFYNKMVILDFISIITYSLINLYILYKNKTEIDSLKFKLLQFISLAFLGMIFMPLIFMMLEVFDMHIDNRLVYIFTLAIVVAIAIYKVKAKGEKLEQVIQAKPQDQTQKYNTSTLSDADLDTYQSKLEVYFEQKKPYLDPELTLQHLALKSDIPKHHLTQVLNTRFHKNFYQYVNEFRVNEVIKNIPLKRNDALVDIAYQCGFNSKSTFNSYFKKMTGLTPSEFKKQNEFTA